MIKIIISFLFPLLIVSSNLALGQSANLATDEKEVSISQKNIYIQTDKEVYKPSEIIWFKAYILNRLDFRPANRSKTLYVTLQHRETKEIVYKERFENLGSFCDGNIFLEEQWPIGLYTLAVFTSESIKDNSLPITSFRTIRLKNNSHQLFMDVKYSEDYYSLDSQVQAELVFYDNKGVNCAEEKMIIEYWLNDDLVDEESILTDQNGRIPLVIKEGYNSNDYRIKIRAKDKALEDFRFELKIPRLDKSLIKFDLFPEGGHLVNSLESKVAFKATNQYGLPLKIKGMILENGEPIGSLSSIHDGMGFFKIRTKSSKRYQIKLSSPVEAIYDFPKIETNGVVISLLNRNESYLKIRIATSNKVENLNQYLEIRARGTSYWKGEVTIQDTQTLVNIPVENLPLGVAELSLKDSENRVLAQRLFYNESPGLKIDLKSAIEPIYNTKEEVTLKFKVTDSGFPIKAHLGLRVYDNVYYEPKLSTTIQTHYHLFSELNGRIYRPNQYFDSSNKNRLKKLDLLLLTHGWRNYVYTDKIIKAVKNYGNSILSDNYVISVNEINRRNKLSGLSEPIWVKMVYSYGIIDKEIKQDGLLEIPLFENEMVFLRLPKGDTYFVNPPNHFELLEEFQSKKGYKSFEPLVVNDNTSYQSSLINYNNQNNTFLDEVLVKASKKRNSYLDKRDRPWVYPGQGDYVCVQFDVLNCVNHSFGGYQPEEGEVYGTNTGGSIVYKRPDDITDESIMNKKGFHYVKGYQLKKEFFSPDYKEMDASIWDERTTLAWAPNLITDVNGEISYSFYTSDINSSFSIHIEGVDLDGNFISRQFEFKVRDQY